MECASHIQCMVRCGVGLMVSLSERAIIQLYHLETLEYLQDINVASAITRTLNGLPCFIILTSRNLSMLGFSLNATCLSHCALHPVNYISRFTLCLRLCPHSGVEYVKVRSPARPSWHRCAADRPTVQSPNLFAASCLRLKTGIKC